MSLPVSKSCGHVQFTLSDSTDEDCNTESMESLGRKRALQFASRRAQSLSTPDPSYLPKELKVMGPRRHSVHPAASAKSSLSSVSEAETESRILVLYSGGTIGMKTKFPDGVYSPEPNFLVPELRKLPIFHDADYAVQFSSDIKEQPLVMPRQKDGKRIVYCVYEYEPLLDSSNMTYDDYARLAKDIEDNYHDFDAFVILHGTDTMAFTASALSFMLENMGKPVILTGSQIPIFEARSDGRDNFLGALIIAGHYNIPEVAIYFDNVLLRGNRSTKVDADAFDAFKSPNMEPLAKMGIDINVDWEAVFMQPGYEKFRVHTNMCRNVGVLRLFPSITEDTVRAFLQPPMEGVVLQTYGAGNGPAARKDLMAVLQDASERGVIIVNCTQCSRGTVSPLYAVGKELLDVGVIAGSDMTVEAALMKLSYVLSHDNLSVKDQRQMMSQNLRGEMTVASKRDQPVIHFSLIDKLAEAMRLGSSQEVQVLKNAVFPYLLCAAAREENETSLQNLKQCGAHFHTSDYDGRTPMHIAACEGHENVIKYLLEKGARVHVRDRYGHSPLDDAIRFNNHDAIRLLIHAGAHLTVPPAKMGMLMCNAVVNDDVKNLESWLLAGADFNQGDYDKRTPLHLAVAHGKIDQVSYLLSKGSDPLQPDIFEHSPLDEARRLNQDTILSMLEASTAKSDGEN